MAQDNNDEGKLEFDSSGQAIAYISLDQACVLALRYARDDRDFYDGQYTGIGLVWEVCRAQERDAYFDIRLSFRPSGSFRGEPGVEQFVFEKNGDLRLRQILDELSGMESTRRLLLSLTARLTAIMVIGGVAAIAGFAINDADETLNPPSMVAPSTSVPRSVFVEEGIINEVPLVEEIVAERDSGQHTLLPTWSR